MDADRDVVWITTRRIKADSYEAFREAWRPKDFPEGMLTAYECWSDERDVIVGFSTWSSLESLDEYRRSDVEAERRRAMEPFVEEESSGQYAGRELEIPND